MGLLAALFFSIINEYFGLDRKLADLIYLAGDHSWALQKNYWYSRLFTMAEEMFPFLWKYLPYPYISVVFFSTIFESSKKFFYICFHLCLSAPVWLVFVSIL